jgi:sec-independent protein translocase protein TatA
MATGLLTPTHIAILLILALVILGPKQLPQAGHALGTGIRELKDVITGRECARVNTQPGGLPDPTIAEDRESSSTSR